jgi:hypothetical protein
VEGLPVLTLELRGEIPGRTVDRLGER